MDLSSLAAISAVHERTGSASTFERSSFLEKSEDTLYLPAICSLFELTSLLKAPHIFIPDAKFHTKVARRLVPEDHAAHEDASGAHYDEDVEFVLGAGASSTVWLMTRWNLTQSSGDFETKTYTAFKRYKVDLDITNSDEAEAKKTLHLMKQELKALQHPRLRGQENICQLISIGWEDDNPTPLLGFEFAEYGTLDDCMQDLRSYSSSERKSHLTLDISLGLAAIHSAGLVHGDFKTRNILIAAHPTRGVIAKVSDLTGVAPVASYAASGFAFSTPKWQPPELLAQSRDIDWQLADVYSLGMVIATMWTTSGYIPSGGTFFDTHVKYKLDSHATAIAMNHAKFADDESENSFMQMALTSVKRESPVELSLEEIIQCTLASQPCDRSSLANLMDHKLSGWAKSQGRESSFPVMDFQSLLDPQMAGSRITPTSFTFSTPNAQLDDAIFKHALAACQRAAGTVLMNPRPDLQDHSLETDELMVLLLAVGNHWAGEDIERTDRQKSLAALFEFVGLTYASRVSSPENLLMSILWLTMAAGLGTNGSRVALSLITELDGFKFPAVGPGGVCLKFWNAVWILHGDTEFGGYLEQVDPALHKKALAAGDLWRWQRDNTEYLDELKKFGGTPNAPEERGRQGLFSDMAVPSSCLYGDDQRTALHLAAAADDVRSVHHLVTQLGADVDATNTEGETALYLAMQNNAVKSVACLLEALGAQTHHVTTAGVTITHALSFMEDIAGAALASSVIRGGARLDKVASKTDFKCLSIVQDAAGLPIYWALLRNRPMLFEEFTRLHKRAPDQRLSVMDYALLLQLAVTYLQPKMLCMAVNAELDIVDMSIITQTSASSQQVSILLRNIHTMDNFTEWFFSEPRKYEYPLLGPREYTRLMYDCMDPMLNKFIRRLQTHRRAFEERRYAMIGVLLHRAELKPTMLAWKGPCNPLYRAIRNGDHKAFAHMLNSMEITGPEFIKIAGNPELFMGDSALTLALKSHALPLFDTLLGLCPDLVNLSLHFNRPLHLAAEQDDPTYTQLLLKHGADPHAQNVWGVDAVVWALAKNTNTKAALEIADMIFARVETEILQPPSPGIKLNEPFRTLTAFGHLMTHSKLQVDRLRHFFETYAEPEYYADIHKKYPVFHIALSARFFSNYSVIDARRGPVTELLLSKFPDKLNALDAEEDGVRFAPLHLAVLYGSLPAIKVLLQRKADLSLETTGTGEMSGHTALGLALYRQSRGPALMCQPGRPSGPWKQEAQEIVILLIDAGSKSLGRRHNPFVGSGGVDYMTIGGLGSYANDDMDPALLDFYRHTLTEEYESHTIAMVHRALRGAASSSKLQRRNQAWPKRLPSEVPGELEHSDENIMSEFIASDGLSSFLPLIDYEEMDAEIVESAPSRIEGYGIPRGFYVPELPATPEKYLKELTADLAERRSKWLVRRGKSNR